MDGSFIRRSNRECFIPSRGYNHTQFRNKMINLILFIYKIYWIFDYFIIFYVFKILCQPKGPLKSL